MEENEDEEDVKESKEEIAPKQTKKTKKETTDTAVEENKLLSDLVDESAPPLSSIITFSEEDVNLDVKSFVHDLIPLRIIYSTNLFSWLMKNLIDS